MKFLERSRSTVVPLVDESRMISSEELQTKTDSAVSDDGSLANMAASDPGRWVFSKDQIQNTPSRRCNVDYDKELYYRQQAATLIQEMGQRLQVTQLCINTAIVYVHRFYMFHSFTKFHRNPIASCALFLAAKVEEQPRKLEHVIRVAHMIIYRDQRHLDTSSEQYVEQAQELITNENILLQTLGFDVAIDHPHTQVLKCCQHLFRASSRDMAQTSYFMATNSLHLTTMCLQYKPTVVACVCIHLVCKWFNYEIPQSNEGKDWFWYVDKSVTIEQLEELTVEFLTIFNKCPSRLRRRVMQQPGVKAAATGVTDKDKESAHQDAHTSLSQKVRTESSNNNSGVAKAGEKAPRPHDQRRPLTATPSSSAATTSSSSHRASSSSSHLHSHSSRPPEASAAGSSSHHHNHPSFRPAHSDKTQHTNQRPSSGSLKDPKLQTSSGISGGGSSSSSSNNNNSHNSSSQQQPRVQQPHVQQHPSSQQQQQRKSSGAPAPSASNAVPKVQQLGGLLSAPRHEQQQQQHDKRNSESTNKKPVAPVFSQDWAGNGSFNPASVQQQQTNLSTSLGFSLDLDDICEQDSTWDINYDLEPNSMSPTAAIESMLNSAQPHHSSVSSSVHSETGGGSGSSQPSKPPGSQQSLFDLLDPSPKSHHSAQPHLNSVQHQQPQHHQQQEHQQQAHISMQHQEQQPVLPHTPNLHQQPEQQQQTQLLAQMQHRSLFDLGVDSEISMVKLEETTTSVVEIGSSLMDDAAEETVDSSKGGDREKKKKKKKEKHKNKDKDKEKEKKHKNKHKEKDKEKRSKDSQRDQSPEPPPKLKISLPSADSVATVNTAVPPNYPAAVEEHSPKSILRLKIPKGRIESDRSIPASVTPAPANGVAAAAAAASVQQPVLPVAPLTPGGGGLKIKISRDMISSTKEKESRKRGSSSISGSGTSSSSLSRSNSSGQAAKMAKIEMGQQQSPLVPPVSVAHHHTSNTLGRPHHERNGSLNAAEDKDNSRHRSHSQQQQQQQQRPVGLNKVSNSTLTNFPPPPYRAFPNHPPIPPNLPYSYPPPPAQTFFPYPPTYPYLPYPPYAAPPMAMIPGSGPPPPLPTGAAGLPPLPREPPPSAPPPPPPPPTE